MQAGWFNLGGPGWFNDVLDIVPTLDSGSKVTSKGLLFDQDVVVYRSNDKITGKLRLSGPPNRTVAHYGVKVELESSIQFYEWLNSVPLVPDDVESSKADACGPGSVGPEGAEIPFELDLSKIKIRGKSIPDTYDGEKFDVRHSLLFTVVRPWYTFNVTRVLSIAIQNVEPAPAADNEGRTVPEQMQMGVPVKRDPVILVDDCGGVVEFSYGRSHWNIGDTLTGTIVVSEQLLKPIVGLKLLLYKIELADGETTERPVKALDIIAPPSSEEAPPADADAPPPPARTVRTTPVAAGETIHVAFKMDAADGNYLGPTIDEMNEPGNAVNVHYYLRFIVETPEDKHWNTHEVIVYRPMLQGILSSADNV